MWFGVWSDWSSLGFDFGLVFVLGLVGGWVSVVWFGLGGCFGGCVVRIWMSCIIRI